MKRNVAQKLIDSHLVEGEARPGTEIGLRIDQTLTQDATGTMVMLELEAMGLDRVRTELSAQYVDHNLIQQDFKNPDDHVFLRSACQRFGVWFSRPGNGVSHPVHQQCFGKPGKTLLGSDSHTPAAGAIGMLAMGAGGIEVAMAMAGHPFYVKMPEVWGVKLTGKLEPGVSAKDVILELLRRHGVSGGVGRVIEYHGPGLAELSVWDRHVIANMGTELGATSTVFPADDEVRRMLVEEGREEDFSELVSDDGADYDVHEEIDLTSVVPLIAKPSSPGNVVPVADVAGEEIYQAYIGSSANPGYRDFAVAAQLVADRAVDPRVSFDINPTSRAILEDLMAEGVMATLVRAGARIHQAGCNGCIGMGQAPASGRNSLRTVPRNFPGRSGTKEDAVWLCNPETAAASALAGAIADPRELADRLRPVAPPKRRTPARELLALTFERPSEKHRGRPLVKGPNIESLPELEPLPDSLEVPVLLCMGDDISTDEIMPAGSRVLPFRSNIPKIAEFCFDPIDDSYAERARDVREAGGHAVVAGDNYGQGSSREHAALAPRFLGLRVVLAKSFARIHWQNLVSFGVLPLTFDNADDCRRLSAGDVLQLDGLHAALRSGHELEVHVSSGTSLCARHALSERQVDVLLAGGLINLQRNSDDEAPRAANG